MTTAAVTEEVDQQNEPTLYFATLIDWYEQWFGPLYHRKVAKQGGQAWCPQWWRHAEAVSRLDAMWRAWEHLRLDPATGISVWFRDHADHHMGVLLDPGGPFMGCNPDDGHRPKTAVLPYQEPPPGLFD